MKTLFPPTFPETDDAVVRFLTPARVMIFSVTQSSIAERAILVCKTLVESQTKSKYAKNKHHTFAAVET